MFAVATGRDPTSKFTHKNKGCIAVDCDAALMLLAISGGGHLRVVPEVPSAGCCALLAFEDLLTTHDVETCGEVFEAFTCAYLDAL